MEKYKPRVTTTVPDWIADSVEALAGQAGRSISEQAAQLITQGLSVVQAIEGGATVWGNLPDGEQILLASPTGDFHFTPNALKDMLCLGETPIT